MKRRILTPVVAVLTIALCMVVAGLVVGTSGALGALTGGVIVVAFFGSTPALLGPVVKATPQLSLVFAMLFFLTKVVALVALFVVLSRASGPDGRLDPESVSVTVIATTLVWLVARIVDATRDRTPTYDLPAETDVTPDRFESQ